MRGSCWTGLLCFFVKTKWLCFQATGGTRPEKCCSFHLSILLAHVFRRSLQDLQDRFPLVAWRTAALLNEFAVFLSCSCLFGFCVFFRICDIFLLHVFPRVWMFLLLQIISVIAAFCCHRVFPVALVLCVCAFLVFGVISVFAVFGSLWQ